MEVAIERQGRRRTGKKRLISPVWFICSRGMDRARGRMLEGKRGEADIK